jgi:3-deoxy-D-manno-octulosonate 8-phosphate phosphatase (KDO 8-P phosphatase)
LTNQQTSKCKSPVVNIIESLSPDILVSAAKIKVLLMDVDGVLTNGEIFYFPGPDGKMVEFKGFNSQDGLALHWCREAGIATGVISGRESPSVNERAKNLGMRYVYQGLLDKVASYEEVLQDAGVTADQVAFIGDDFTDVPLMVRSGLGFAPANARPEVLAKADYITQVRGGDGAVREIIELIFRAQDRWQGIIEKYHLGA